MDTESGNTDTSLSMKGMDIEGVNVAMGLHIKGTEKSRIGVDIVAMIEESLGTDAGSHIKGRDMEGIAEHSRHMRLTSGRITQNGRLLVAQPLEQLHEGPVQTTKKGHGRAGGRGAHAPWRP